MVSVRQASVLPSVPSRLSLTEDALSVQLIVPFTGHIENFHPLRACALPGARKKKIMPAYFFDTSALVKRYHVEEGSEKVDEIFNISERSTAFNLLPF